MIIIIIIINLIICQGPDKYILTFVNIYVHRCASVAIFATDEAIYTVSIHLKGCFADASKDIVIFMIK